MGARDAFEHNRLLMVLGAIMLDVLMSVQWSAVLQIVLIDLLLGGDNAVVIALACRNLPAAQRNRAIWWGAAGAIVLRIACVSIAVMLLDVPLLKLTGGLLLLWIGIKLIAGEDGEDPNISASGKLLAAIRTIVLADAIMSIDNVIAVAGAAESAGGAQRYVLIVFGLLVSIPVIVWGSRFVLKIFDRFPGVITLGAALLGWIAAGLITGEPFVRRWVAVDDSWQAMIVGTAGALCVVVPGSIIARRRAARAKIEQDAAT
jgi:YjbE family integral membrane protein